MATTTTNLTLRKPAGTDTVDEQLDLNNNWDAIDSKWAVTTPSTQAVGDAAAGGSSLIVSRGDHKHAMPAFGTPVDLGAANANGSAATLARSDHVHGSGVFAANTASAATVALPAGRYIPITGTTGITTITGGVAGRVVTLIFASRGCRVALGAGHIMQGPYFSDVGGTLTLFHDGTVWREEGRAGYVVPGARYRLSANVSIVQGADRVVTWDAESWNYTLTPTPIALIVPGIIGRWLVHGLVVWDDSVTDKNRVGHLALNGAVQRRLFDWTGGTGAENNSTAPGAFSEEIEVAAITDTYSLVLFTTGTANILGGGNESHMNFSFIGR